jgi:formylglycine-generating enzyme required for sulfatase activity
MGGNVRGGISRGGVAGSFTYATKSDMANKPVNFVSWYDAARFANWVQHGQPTGPEGPGTTEDGAYLLLGGTATPSNGLTVTRDPTSSYFLPSENEWYKAAFFNPGNSQYFLYPTASNAAPVVGNAIDTVGPTRGNIGNPGTNVANYNNGADWNAQDGNVTTIGTAGAASASPYGTFDQGGNIQEWNESLGTASTRVLRGGSWSNNFLFLQSGNRSISSPTTESNNIGFRIAQTPEPASLSALASGAVLLRRRRR